MPTRGAGDFVQYNVLHMRVGNARLLTPTAIPI